MASAAADRSASSPPTRAPMSSGSPTASNSAAPAPSPERWPRPSRGHSLSVVLDRTTPARHFQRRQSRRRARRASDARPISTRAAPASCARSTRRGARSARRRSTSAARWRRRRSFELPVELRNEISRLVVADETSAGATWLIDERSRRRRVAILSGASADVAQPLLSPTYYIKRALAPFAEIREARGRRGDPIEALLAEKPSVLALADMSVPPGPAHDELARIRRIRAACCCALPARGSPPATTI